MKKIEFDYKYVSSSIIYSDENLIQYYVDNIITNESFFNEDINLKRIKTLERLKMLLNNNLISLNKLNIEKIMFSAIELNNIEMITFCGENGYRFSEINTFPFNYLTIEIVTYLSSLNNQYFKTQC